MLDQIGLSRQSLEVQEGGADAECTLCVLQHPGAAGALGEHDRGVGVDVRLLAVLAAVLALLVGLVVVMTVGQLVVVVVLGVPVCPMLPFADWEIPAPDPTG